MPLKLNLGISKKIGQPDYGSLGAQCNVEVELDSALINDLDTFHSRVRRAYAACRQAVEDELLHQQEPDNNGSRREDNSSSRFTPRNGTSRNGRNGSNNGSTAPKNGKSHRASSKQMDYLNRLSQQIPGMGVRKLESLCQEMFEKPIATLSSFEASSLIDVLKQAKSGDLDLSQFLEGARG